MGFCSGIENYSRHLDGRKPGEPPYTLIDYFPKDMLCIIDETHVTVPQIRGMHEGDRSRKITLVEHGFRLPSALDNRPLRFDEFEARVPQFLYVSATPGDYEEQVSRADGGADHPSRRAFSTPRSTCGPSAARSTTSLDEIRARVAKRRARARDHAHQAHGRGPHGLPARTAGVKVDYMHSDIATLDRVEIIRDLRTGKIDVLVGINLLA